MPSSRPSTDTGATAGPGQGHELDLGPEFAAPTRRPVLVHLPRIWTNSFSLRINWLTKNFDSNGAELPIDPPPAFSLPDEEDEKRNYFVSIGGMDGPRSKKFVADRHLTLREARLLAGLLTFRSHWGDTFELPRLELRPLNRVLKTGDNPGDTAGGQRIAALRDDLENLEGYWIRTHRPWLTDGPHSVSEKLIQFKKNTSYKDGKPHSIENVSAEWIESFAMNSNFLKVINQDGRAVRLDVLNSFQSEMLQLWYLVIPALASHPNISASNPWERTLRNLFHVAGVSFKSWGAKDFRLARGGKLAVEQLDGAATLNGRLRVKLALTSDRDDWKLQAWIEKPPKQRVPYNPDGFLYTYWMAAGKTQQEFEERLRRIASLSSYDIELLEIARYPYRRAGDAMFLKQAKALLGEHRFTFALSRAKDSIQAYLMNGGCDSGKIVGTAIKDAYKLMLQPRND